MQHLSCSDDGGGYGTVGVHMLMSVYVFVLLCVCVWYDLCDLISQLQSKGYQWAQRAPGHAD